MITTFALATAIKVSAPIETELTIYNDGYALVKSNRTLDLKKGVFPAIVADVAQQIEANSVGIRALGDKGAFSVLEQNYKYDLVNVNAILNKSVGSMIKLHRVLPNGQTEVVRGKLLSSPTSVVSDANGGQSQVYNGMVVQAESGEILLNPEGTVEVESIPTGMISTPSLVWLLDSNKDGSEPIELSYLTRGMSWKSDYVLSLDKDGTLGDLKGWVTLTNNSGTTFNNAKLKLLAGEVNRAPTGAVVTDGLMLEAKPASANFAKKDVKEETFGEYHLYTVQHPVTTSNNEIKQVSLLDAAGIKVHKLLLVDSMYGYGTYYPNEAEVGTGPIKPTVYLEIENKKENNLGVPLPKGTFKVFQTSQSGSLELLGEDSIDHTPKDEKLKLRVGKAFDIVAERKRLSFTKVSRNRIRETFSIELRNRKETAETVNVWERHWGDHLVTNSNIKGNWLDSDTLEFVVSLGANETKTVNYTIETKW